MNTEKAIKILETHVKVGKGNLPLNKNPEPHLVSEAILTLIKEVKK